MSTTGSQIRDKIIELYPEITKFNIGVDTEFSDETNEWVVTLTKGENTLFTHIKADDALKCVEGEKCVYFGHQLMGFMDAYCSGSEACEV